MVLGLKRGRLRAGLYGYCGFLLGMALALFTPAWSWKTIVLVVIGAPMTTLMTMSISEWTAKHSLPALTTAFVLTTSLVILLVRVSPNLDQEILLLSNPHLFRDPSSGQVSTAARDGYRGLFAGIAQTVLVAKPERYALRCALVAASDAHSPYSGIVMIIGVCFFSRVATVAGIVGSLIGYLLSCVSMSLRRATLLTTHRIVLGIDSSVAVSGLWGYNPTLTAIAVCGLFYKFNVKSVLVAVYAVVVRALTQLHLFFFSPCTV